MHSNFLTKCRYLVAQLVNFVLVSSESPNFSAKT